MNVLLICCFIKGCVCPAALWREFGQVWWCREHPCWNGNILSSPGNNYFAVCIYVNCFLSEALVYLVLIWLFSIRMTIWIVMVILNLLARLVHLSISVTWTSILVILIFFLLAILIWSMLIFNIDRNWYWRLQVLMASCASPWACWWEPKAHSICKSSPDLFQMIRSLLSKGLYNWWLCRKIMARKIQLVWQKWRTSTKNLA
jgi:hypothetical protein